MSRKATARAIRTKVYTNVKRGVKDEYVVVLPPARKIPRCRRTKDEKGKRPKINACDCPLGTHWNVPNKK